MKNDTAILSKVLFLSMVLITILGSTARAQETNIGNQTWSTINLNVSTFKNGDTIPEAKTDKEWQDYTNDRKPAWCYYNNNVAYGKKYGKLYNWYAISDARGLAPQGWHIASDAEWSVLVEHLGGKELAGTKMKSTNFWTNYKNTRINGTNTSSFNFIPGGWRDEDGFNGMGRFGYCWSSTEIDNNNALRIGLGYNTEQVETEKDTKSSGFSIRCIKD